MDNERKCSDTGCSQGSCEGCSQSAQQVSLLEDLNAYSHVKKVIGIVSGKGGVGKSLVTSSLAVELQKKGYKVGILDADITGPSIPKMFGITGKAKGSEQGLHPEASVSGIKIMSINLLLETDDTPVIWRGPVIAGVVKQFWTDVVWGELDYLLIDMPPGTGDVPLTVFQSIPVDGIVIVTSPQDLVNLIVKKAYNMAEKMNIPVLGLIENYSYLMCPDCGKKINIFGKGKTEEEAEKEGLEMLGNVPVMPHIAELADEGRFDEAENPYIAKAVDKIDGMLR
ncbi:Mrp/NBP35 family ATP-binding protein [Parasporobacterium paucivorans]|uniref:Iron-sulfur cluster carrier protein n=1 Tax=Parasporobacterium paucivorans DSM 15970 TaxID=1122934 RepID=A0A1M6FKA1_9FIRM|nr:Mrp/NBP35 family ATP-binding protein [Parasporobacterium paucivorans]SHI98072.1 Chromosome partitioning ATPase, Mrp family, contains Fe-S cluster [Parasporobacterium paucivorans DSM 15970]